MLSFKKITPLVIVLLMSAMTLAACGGNNTPEDTQAATTDTKATTEAATEAPTEAATEAPATVSCTFTVKDQDGNAIPAVAFDVKQNGTVVANATTDTVGKATVSVPLGSCVVEFTRLPDDYTADSTMIQITEATAEAELSVKNTTPNGKADRPFVLTEDTTEMTLPANCSVHYIFYGGSNRYLYVENTTATITYKEQTYAPDEGGNLKVDFVTEGPRDPVTFAVNNPTDAEMTITLRIQSKLGSIENPVAVSELNTTVTANVPKEGTVYYQWVATADGVLGVLSANPKNNITLTNRRNSAASYFTDGSACEYIEVKTGDEVLVSVGALSKEASTEIAFSLFFSTGAGEDPVILHKNKVSLHCDAGACYAFAYTPEDNGQDTVKVKGAKEVVVIDLSEETDQSYLADDNGDITFTVQGSTDSLVLFLVECDTAEGGEVTISFASATSADTEAETAA